MQNILSAIAHYQRQCAIIMVFIATLAIGYNLIIKPAQQQLTNLKKSNANITHTLQNTRHLLTQKITIQQTIKQLEMQYKNNSPFNWKALLADLTNAAAINKVNLTIAQQSTLTQDGIDLYPLNLETTGTYQQLAQFVNLLAQTPYAIELTNLSVIPTASPPQLSLRINCSIFRPQMTSSAATAANQTVFALPKINYPRDPFSVDAKKLPLTSWNSNSLKFIGLITQNTKIWAIVSDPDGFMHHVTLGTIIGINQTPIIKITDDTIITKNSIDNLYRVQK